jgi:A/G-specific adenine glycosylase
MAGVPTTGWSVRSDGATGRNSLPFKAQWRMAGSVSHAFTHFDLTLEVWLAEWADGTLPLEGWWTAPEALSKEALPTVMKKALVAAIPSLASRFAKGNNSA